MPFAEREPFVHSGVQSDDLAWNKAGTSFGTKLWQRSHVAGWRSTSSNTHRRLAPTWEWVLKRNRDVSTTVRRRKAGVHRLGRFPSHFVLHDPYRDRYRELRRTFASNARAVSRCWGEELLYRNHCSLSGTSSRSLPRQCLLALREKRNVRVQIATLALDRL